MEVTIEPQGHATAIVRLVGRLDLISAGPFKERVVEAVADGQQRLVVDLQAVPFVDSSGLGALIAGLKSTRLAGGDLRIARAADQTAMILALTNLNRVLVSYGTVEEALASF
jgi:anti-sigma B factor antagonist